MSNDPFAFLDDADDPSNDPAPDELMIELDDDTEEVAEPVDEGFDEGQGEVEDTPPEPTYFDPSEYADQLVKLNSHGEQVEVPLSEVTQGYLRQADYTQKTQELAQQRESLAYWQTVDTAMRENPELGWQYLQNQFAPKEQELDDDGWGLDEPDPVQQELKELRAQVAPVQQFVQEQQAQALLSQVTNGLSQKYGEDFVATDVLNEAVNRGVYDPNMLETVYQTMAFEKMRAERDANVQTATAKQSQSAQRKQAAAKAAAITGAGPSAAGAGSASNDQPSQPMSVREAWMQAKAQLQA